ncbi:MAG: carbohydrate ABC transporter permease [Proteobacteria bacterium]|nr:carbohydrate ABC transporter permease [Pseudomonadota bacterium]
MTKTSSLSRFLTGRPLTHLFLFLLVMIWTAPTLGLLISSFRDKEQLIISGWWSSFSSSEQSKFGRIGGSDDQIEENGKFVITGSFLEEGSESRIIAFGDRSNDPGKYQIGETIQHKNGATFTLFEDGRYRWESPTPAKRTRGRRYFYVMESPPSFTLDNYREVLASQGLGQSFINTLTVTIPATIIPIMIAAFAAYAFSWMRFPGRNLLFIVVVGLLVVPLQMSLIPLLRLYNSIGEFFDVAAKSYLGIWLAHTGFGLPLAIYLLRNYMSSLPKDIIESARIDGATHFQIFTKIIVPLSVPALASFAIFQFLWVWNDLLVALVFLGKADNQIVLTSKLRELLGSHGANWEILTASAFVSIVVPLLVFFALQRYFVRGLMTGSVKG